MGECSRRFFMPRHHQWNRLSRPRVYLASSLLDTVAFDAPSAREQF
jgi:hypothetical protein